MQQEARCVRSRTATWLPPQAKLTNLPLTAAMTAAALNTDAAVPQLLLLGRPELVWAAEPIAFAGPDRFLYDLEFFNASAPAGSIFFAAAMRFCPQLGIFDAAFCVLIDGVQHHLPASRRSARERPAPW